MGRRRAGWVLAAILLLAACNGGGGSGGPGSGDGPRGREPLPRLHAVRGERPGIFDEDGRQVVLRGVNLNGLAEYARNNPDLDPTIPITGETWDQIAAEGFDVVRLLVSWSRLEPERGQIDEGYVAEIRAAVRAAARRGLYTVVDMHQDAWGPYVATPAGVSCPAGREPANGWDGAPEWATPSPDELDSCRAANGEAKPGSDLVVEAWHRFYTDADGIQTRLVAVWEHLAEALAGEPSIAGYDLLNEPGHGRPGESAPTALLEPFPLLGDFYDRAIDAIRQGEEAGSVEPRPIFFEHTVVGNPPPADFSDDPGLVFAPHIYGGSIVGFLTVDQNWDLVLSGARGWQTSVWVGEYGWWDDPAERPELLERVGRFAVREDGGPVAGSPDRAPFVPAGSAWWQWNNGCGDPHQIVDPGGPAPAEVRQYRVTSCADGEAHDEGVVPGWQQILTRPAVRYAPGWITALESDHAAATLDLQAVDAQPGTRAELWVPGEDRPEVGGTGIARLKSKRAGRGWRVTVTVCEPTYQVSVGASANRPPSRCAAAG